MSASRRPGSSRRPFGAAINILPAHPVRGSAAAKETIMKRPMPHPLLSTAASVCLLALASAVAAQQDIDETRTLAPNARIEVHNVKGSIRISAGAEDRLRLSGRLGDKARLKLAGDGPDALKIEVDYPSSSGWGWGWGGGGGGESHLVLELPRTVELDVSAVSAEVEIRGISGPRLEAETVSGALALSDSAPQRLVLSTVSGALRADTGAEALQLESVSGEVRVRASQARTLRAETVSGALEVELGQPAEELRLETVSGSARLAGGPAPGGQLRAETLGGRLRIELPAATSAKIRADSFSGRIRSAVGEIEKAEYGPGSSLRGQLGDGSAKIVLETFSGDLELRVEGR
jgi:hypothetical protein